MRTHSFYVPLGLEELCGWCSLSTKFNTQRIPTDCVYLQLFTSHSCPYYCLLPITLRSKRCIFFQHTHTARLPNFLFHFQVYLFFPSSAIFLHWFLFVLPFLSIFVIYKSYVLLQQTSLLPNLFFQLWVFFPSCLYACMYSQQFTRNSCLYYCLCPVLFRKASTDSNTFPASLTFSFSNCGYSLLAVLLYWFSFV